MSQSVLCLYVLLTVRLASLTSSFEDMAAMQETSRINDSKEGLAEKEDIEPSSTKLRQEDHDAPLTEDDIAFVENFAQSPEKSRLMRKIDLRILPILILLYLISFIGEFPIL